MCSFARHIVHDGHLAESIVDDVVFNIWENRRSLHVKSSLRTYLLSAVRYRCINEMKSPYRRFSRMQTTIPPGDSTDFVMSLFADARHPLRKSCKISSGKVLTNCQTNAAGYS